MSSSGISWLLEICTYFILHALLSQRHIFSNADIPQSECQTKLLRMFTLQVGVTVQGYVSSISKNGHIYFQILGPGLKTLEHSTALMGETCDSVR